MHEAEDLPTPVQVGARNKPMSKGKHLAQTQVADAAMVGPQFIGSPEQRHSRTELAMVMRVGAVVELRIG